MQAILTVAFHNNEVSVPRLTKNTNCFPLGSIHFRELRCCYKQSKVDKKINIHTLHTYTQY